MKRTKPDDYFSTDFIKDARFDNTVVVLKNMAEERHRERTFWLASQYTKEKGIIDDIVKKIKDKLTLVDPLTLFDFLTSMNTMMLMSSRITSEGDISDDVNFQLRSVEYIQSLLVSMKHDKADEINRNEQEKVCHEIANLSFELYSKIPLFYVFWSQVQICV